MRPRNLELIDLAKKYVQEEMPYCTYACVIGSVARGEADDYSDIDIICFTGRETYLGKNDVLYKDEIIQMDVKSILEFPNKELFSYNPWHYRFLTESVIIKDTNGELSKLQGWAKSYYSSLQGQRDVIQDVETLISGRKDYAFEQMNKGKEFAATHAAIGVWTEASLLYQFLHEGKVSIGLVMPTMRRLDLFPLLAEVLPFSPGEQIDLKEVMSVLNNLRTHLRQAGFTHLPRLSSVQEELSERKGERLRLEGDLYNFVWQAYSEAFLLLLETSQDEDFEDYFQKLPTELKQGLRTLGFKTMDPDQIHKLLDIADDILELSKHELKTEQSL